MKEFDFVKLTLWISLASSAALGGGYVWLGDEIVERGEQIESAETTCHRVGQIAHDLAMLEQEKRAESTPDYPDVGVNSFFAASVSRAGANGVYSLKPGKAEPSKDKTYQDTPYVVEFERDQFRSREQIFAFIWSVERSRRIKLARAKISLVTDRAIEDLWVPESLTFERRDPIEPKAAESK